ncbi:unnamed protein product [Brassica oleracea var. botrytis]|uniref:RING-type E3 ubiquitin transferase n=1 Tax=Brassica oleracea TaxID=3712 RepID=A0A3P6AUS1_BRAOL|nr:unnamed protein product [Brassica oleracea]
MEETQNQVLEEEAKGSTTVEKVYIAVGNDLQEGFKTIDWALKKWDNISISIVLLHLCSISQDFVYTPFGKLPASSVSEEKLQVLRKYEDQKINKLLSKYVTFCKKLQVEAELHKVEKEDDSIQVLILDLITKLRITKLVMGITFMRSSSSWKSKSAISGSFHIYQNKPDFCEFYIICGGKMVLLKRENDANNNIRSWIGKMFHDPGRNLDRSSNGSDDPAASGSPWDKNLQEMEIYFQQLLSLNLEEDDEDNVQEEEDEDGGDEVALDVLQHLNVGEKLEYVRRKVNEAKLMIDENMREVKVNAERSDKAEWAISLCNCRIEELEAGIKEETERREKQLQGTLDSDRECIEQTKNDVEKGKAKLVSLGELREELSSKVETMREAKQRAEAELERVALEKGEMIMEIEKLKNQRDVFNRRIEFCKEKGLLDSKEEEVKCGYREYVAEDIRLATESYSDRLRLKSGGNWTNVYRGRIKHTTMAVKVIGDRLSSDEEFAAKVKLLNEIRHPNLVAIAGFSSERPKCILFEYMHSGNLRDNLFTSQRKSRRSKILKWHDRIRIAHQVCSGLGFLHSVKPKPIVHGRLTPSKILLDRNLVAKITGFGLVMHSDQSDTKPDVMAFGVLLLHLLTGRNWPGLLKAMSMNQASILRDLDQTAGKWPLELAKEFGALAVKCSSVNRGGNMDFSTKEIMEELGKIMEKANEFRTKGGYEEATNSKNDEADPNDIPSVFICPILQEVMKNPHIAADGFSYELEAIEEWLSMGHDTSPMTNLRLDYQVLTPNHTLRALIQDWHSKKAAQASS